MSFVVDPWPSDGMSTHNLITVWQFRGKGLKKYIFDEFFLQIVQKQPTHILKSFTFFFRKLPPSLISQFLEIGSKCFGYFRLNTGQDTGRIGH